MANVVSVVHCLVGAFCARYVQRLCAFVISSAVPEESANGQTVADLPDKILFYKALSGTWSLQSAAVVFSILVYNLVFIAPLISGIISISMKPNRDT